MTLLETVTGLPGCGSAVTDRALSPRVLPMLALRRLLSRDTSPVAQRRGRPPKSVDTARQPGHDLVSLIAAMSQGDRQAFASLYAATSAKLYGIVLRIVRQRDVADDVVQDVCVLIWQRAATFDAKYGTPIAWLATIARNRALDELKRKTMRSIEEFPELLELPGDDDPRLDLERSEEMRQLEACLARLEPKKREIVLLAYYHGLTREEIAQRIGQPVCTVKTWLRRSLLQLKDHVANDGTAFPALACSQASEAAQQSAARQAGSRSGVK